MIFKRFREIWDRFWMDFGRILAKCLEGFGGITPAAFGNALRSRNDITILIHTDTAGIIDVSVHQFIVVECLVLKV